MTSSEYIETLNDILETIAEMTVNGSEIIKKIDNMDEVPDKWKEDIQYQLSAVLTYLSLARADANYEYRNAVALESLEQ